MRLQLMLERAWHFLALLIFLAPLYGSLFSKRQRYTDTLITFGRQNLLRLTGCSQNYTDWVWHYSSSSQPCCSKMIVSSIGAQRVEDAPTRWKPGLRQLKKKNLERLEALPNEALSLDKVNKVVNNPQMWKISEHCHEDREKWYPHY